jgi:hypothetical protein
MTLGLGSSFHRTNLGDDETDLKVVAAIDENERAAVVHLSQQLLRVIRVAADSEPQHIDRNTDFQDLQLSVQLSRLSDSN